MSKRIMVDIVKRFKYNDCRDTIPQKCLPKKLDANAKSKLISKVRKDPTLTTLKLVAELVNENEKKVYPSIHRALNDSGCGYNRKMARCNEVKILLCLNIKVTRCRHSFMKNQAFCDIFIYLLTSKVPQVSITDCDEIYRISEEEKQSIKAYLERSSFDINNVDKLAFYKVCFTLVSKLIRKRQVFLKMGIAYVPETRLSSIIFFEFKRSLSEGFAYSRHIVSNVYNDQRLIKLFNVLQNSVHIQDFNYAGSRKISIDELDELSKISYPLCMKVLHEALRTKHHLTNGGRVQYCLFLKGIGLDLNDALKFWTDEFTKIIDENTFDKNYKYNIRHLYGQEGRRADYTPFDCTKIMNSIISPRDNHGCPFKYMTADLLNETLSKAGVVQSDVEAIMKFSEKHYYSLACKMYYEVTHECVTDDIIEHPNLYFNNSRNKFEGPHSPEAPTCNDEIVIVHEQESQNG